MTPGPEVPIIPRTLIGFLFKKFLNPLSSKYSIFNKWKYPDIIKLATKLEYSPHNANILWTLKKLFCMSSNLLKSMSFRRESPFPNPVSFCKFWIYIQPVNSKFTIWHQTHCRNFAYISNWSSCLIFHRTFLSLSTTISIR